jgi:hypothetical protein
MASMLLSFKGEQGEGEEEAGRESYEGRMWGVAFFTIA